MRSNGYYAATKVFDISQTYGNKPYSIAAVENTKQIEKAIDVMREISPIPVLPKNEVEGCCYDAERQELVFCAAIPPQELLQRLPAEIVMAVAESAYAGISENELLRQTAAAISVEVCGRLGLPMPPDAVQTLEGMKEHIPDGEERRALEKVRETAVTFGDAVCKRLKLERGQPAPQREERRCRMRSNRTDKTELILWALLLLPLLWLAAALAQAAEQAHGLAEITALLSELIQTPAALHWCQNTPKFLLAVLVIYPLAVYCYKLDQADRRPGEEHGSAHWGSVRQLNAKYQNRKDKVQNYIFSQNIRFSTDSHAHRHNLNVVVIGGSGSGKTRFYVKPNAMQASGSYLFLDPKGELVRSLGGFYESLGIPVTVIDLVHFKGHYNPMHYIDSDEDAVKLAYAIVNNTKPKDAPASGGDKFWDDASVLLISALILYLIYEAPVYEQNFSTLMYMIQNCQMEEGDMGPNPLEMLFNELQERDPLHPAVLQFNSFKLGSTKTLQSVLITASANLYMFNTAQFAEMTNTDTMFLPRLGLEKRVIFCVIPDNDKTYNFLITMLYTQLFDQLFRLADSEPKFDGALPVHVRFMMDEFANVALPSNFKNILAVCRSRNISCDIILQSKSQIQSLYKDDWEGMIGNCDSLIYLGGNEYATFEWLSKYIGKMTERTKSQSIGRGSRGSSSDSYQLTARDLCSPDEIRRMDDGDCLVLLRSEPPVIDRKFDLMRHPNVKLTPDGGAAPYRMPDDYAQTAQTISPDVVTGLTEPAITDVMYDEIQKIMEEIHDEQKRNL